MRTLCFVGIALCGTSIAHATSFAPGSAFDQAIAYNPDNEGILTVNGVDYALPSTLIPDAAFGASFRTTADEDVVFARRFSTSGATVCASDDGRAGDRIVFFRPEAGPPSRLVEIAEICVTGPLTRSGFVGSPAGLYTAFVFSSGNNGRIAGTFVDLLGDQSRRRVEFNETLGDIRFSSDGSLALVQHDTGSAQSTDYQFIDLCPGSLGDTAGPLLTDFSNTDPYETDYSINELNRSVEFSVGSDFTTTVTADPCFSANPNPSLALDVEATLESVSENDTLIDVTLRYRIGSGYDNAGISGVLPPGFDVVSDPMDIVDGNGAIAANALTGAGELSFRVDYREYGSRCMGIRLNNFSPYSITAVRTVGDTQQFATQFGGTACTEGPELVIRKILPAEVLPLEPFAVTLEYENTGDLVTRDVLIDDVLDGRADRAAIIVTGDEDTTFSLDSPVSAIFELGDVPAGASGRLVYTGSASCLADTLFEGALQLFADPGPLQSIVNGRDEQRITVNPYVLGAMNVDVLGDRDVSDGAGPVRYRVTYDNQVDQERPASFRVVTGECWTVSEGSGDGTFVSTGPIASWRTRIPANSSVSAFLTFAPVECAATADPQIDGGQSVDFDFGCSESVSVDLDSVAVGDIGPVPEPQPTPDPDPEPEPDPGMAGNPPAAEDPPAMGGSESEDSSGGCAAVPFSFLVLLPARLRRRLR